MFRAGQNIHTYFIIKYKTDWDLYEFIYFCLTRARCQMASSMHCFQPSSANTFDYSSELLIGCCHLLPETINYWTKVLLYHFQSQVHHRPSSHCQCLRCKHCHFCPLAFLGIQCLISPEWCVFLMCFLNTLWWMSAKSSCLRTGTGGGSTFLALAPPWNDTVKSAFSDCKKQYINANTNICVSIGHSMEFKRLQE